MLGATGRERLRATALADVLLVTRDGLPGDAGPGRRALVINFGATEAPISALAIPHTAELLASSHDGAWREGTLGPYAAALFSVAIGEAGRAAP